MFRIVARRALLASALAILLCAALAGRASALGVHGEGSAGVGPDGTTATSFGSAAAIDYQQANDRLYVLAEYGINGFSHPSFGTFTPLGGSLPFSVVNSNWETDVAVDNSATATANDLYYASNTLQVGSFDSNGGARSGWPVEGSGEACGTAVDASGDVWAAQHGGTIREYSSAGSPIRTISSGGELCKIAVDPSNGDLYGVDLYGGYIHRWTAASGYANVEQIAIFYAYNARLAIDGQRHVLYAGGPYTSEIRAYDTLTGALVDTTPMGPGSQGLAADEGNGNLFVLDGNGKLRELPLIFVPKATTGPPTGTYEVSGTADPDGAGDITECFFEFGSSSSYGSTQACAESTPISSAETVHAVLPGLEGESTYHYRLVLGNAEGLNKGADMTIVPHPVKGISTDPATQVTRTGATLNGHFEGSGLATTYYFEYGTDTGYGSRVPAPPNEEDAGTTTGPTPMAVSVTGLQPATTYHFRVVAKNAEGTSPGPDQSFTTPVAVADLQTEDATEVTRHSATLNGSFTGTGEEHTFYFEWGPSASYGSSTPVESAGTGTGTVSVSAALTGLTQYLPDTPTYHYRVVVTNGTGTTYGPDHTFMTAAPDKPQVSVVGASDVDVSGATLGATINPLDGPTIYAFEYGRSPEYGSSTATAGPLAGDEADHQVSATLSGLEPGATYHVRVVAINFAGTTHGPDSTFTTASPPVPPVSTPPPASAPAAPAPTAPKAKKCKHGFVKRHGRCVKRRKHRPHRHKGARNG